MDSLNHSIIYPLPAPCTQFARACLFAYCQLTSYVARLRLSTDQNRWAHLNVVVHRLRFSQHPACMGARYLWVE